MDGGRGEMGKGTENKPVALHTHTHAHLTLNKNANAIETNLSTYMSI